MGDSLYSTGNIMLMHHLMAALRAHSLFHLISIALLNLMMKQPEIVIVDEHRRLMDGRRWSVAFTSSMEAKEGR